MANEQYFRSRYFEVSCKSEKRRYFDLYLKSYFKNRGIR